MGRIRSIKPDFFLHEGLAELSPLHRLLFIGLWTQADKSGRLEDRPRRLKAALLPWEDCDIDGLLWGLDEGGFIARYSADGKDCIEILNFPKHQRPHPKEASADLPPLASAGVAVRAKPAVPGNSTASRETSRKEMEDQPGIPSSPAGGGSGSGLLVSGGGDGAPPENPPPAPHVHTLYQRPTKPTDTWLAEDFFAWAQVKRQEVGFIGERQRPRALGSWYSSALMTLQGNVEALQDAFLKFGDDAHWQNVVPPLPFGAFIAQWDKYVPRGAVHVSA